MNQTRLSTALKRPVVASKAKLSNNSVLDAGLTAGNIDMKALQKELEKDPKHESRITKLIKQVKKSYLALKKGFFASLVALLVESHNSTVAVIIIFIEFLQNLAFCFADVEWGYYGNKYGYVLILFQIEEAVVKYTFPQAILVLVAIAVILIVTMIVLAIYVVRSFMNSDFNQGVWPLRLLRTLVSMLASIFFLPVMYSLLTIFTCHNGLHDCDSDPVFIGLRIVSAIALPTFFAFTLLMSMTYFNPNPKSPSLSARPTARLELLELSAKTLLAAFFVFAIENPILRESVTLICSFSTALFMWLYIPYYRKEMNLYRFCLICQVIWGSIVAIVVTVMGTSDELRDHIFFAYLAGIIPGLILSYVSFNTRQNRATSFEIAVKNFKPNNPDAFNVWEAEEEAKDGEFEKRFWSESQVEIATRFLIGSEDPKAMEVADKIYLFGTKKFPNSSALMVQYAIFFLVFKEDSSVAASYLKKAEKKWKLIDTEFTIYQQQQEIKSGGATVGNKKLDAVDRVEFKQLMKEAKRYYSEARASIANFWLAIMTAEEDEVADTAVLMTHVSQMERSDQNATEAFNRLIQRYPLSVKVLSSYADFLDDIHNNHEESELIRRRMKRICDAGLSDDNTLTTQVVGGPTSRAASVAATGINSHMTKKSKKAFKEYRKQVYNYSRGNSTLLTWMVRGIQIFYMALASAQLYVSILGSQMMTTGMTWLETANKCRDAFPTIHTSLRQLQSTLQPNYPQNTSLLSLINNTLVTLDENSLKLYGWTNARMSVNNIWALPEIPIVFYNGAGSVNNQTIINMALMDATSVYIRRTSEAVAYINFNQNIAQLSSKLDTENLDWRFALDNGIVTISNAYTEIEHTLAAEIRNDIMSVQYGQIGIIVFCLISLVVTGFYLFVPVINRARTERETSLKAFLQIPRDVTNALYGKYYDAESSSREDLNDEKDDDENDDERESKESSNSVMSQMKAQTGYRSMKMIARNGLLCIAVFFVASFSTDLALLLGVMSIPGGISDSYDISSRVSRIVIVANDISTWGTTTIVYATQGFSQTLKSIITVDIREILNSQLALLYGSTNSPHYELRLSSSVISSISASRFSPGVYEALSKFVDDSTLLSNTNPILPNNPYLSNIAQEASYISNGYQKFSADYIHLSSSNIALLANLAYVLWAILVIMIISTYYIYWKRILNYLIKTENERTLKLLLMIPVEIVADIDSLRELLHLKRNTITNAPNNAPPMPPLPHIGHVQRSSVVGNNRNSTGVYRQDSNEDEYKPVPTQSTMNDKLVPGAMSSSIRRLSFISPANIGKEADSGRRASSGSAAHLALLTSGAPPPPPVPRLSSGVQSFLARESARRQSNEQSERSSEVKARTSTQIDLPGLPLLEEDHGLMRPASYAEESKNSANSASLPRKVSTKSTKSVPLLPNREDGYTE